MDFKLKQKRRRTVTLIVYFPQRGYRIKPTNNQKTLAPSTDGLGQAEGHAGLAVTAHSDALAPHEEEATEAQDAAQG